MDKVTWELKLGRRRGPARLTAHATASAAIKLYPLTQSTCSLPTAHIVATTSLKVQRKHTNATQKLAQKTAPKTNQRCQRPTSTIQTPWNHHGHTTQPNHHKLELGWVRLNIFGLPEIHQITLGWVRGPFFNPSRCQNSNPYCFAKGLKMSKFRIVNARRPGGVER